MKIKENVSFNIASEASYVYNLSGGKLIKNAKLVEKFNPNILSNFQTMWTNVEIFSCIDSEIKKNEQKEKWFLPTYFLNLLEVFQRADR